MIIYIIGTLSIFSFAKFASSIRKIVYFILFFCLFNVFANASETGWMTSPINPNAKVNIRVNKDAPKHLQILLDLQLNQHWKTYWRSPSGNVQPLNFKWKNASLSSTTHWPTPTQFDVSGIAIQGYNDRVSIAFEFDGELPDILKGELTLPVCSDVCTLVHFPLSLLVEPTQDFAFETDYFNALNKAPKESGLFDHISTTLTQNTLTISAHGIKNWHDPHVFIEKTASLNWINAPKIDTKDDQLTMTLSLIEPPITPSLPLHIIIVDHGNAQQTQLTLSEQNTPSTLSLAIIGYALLGGFILNLMPCVFPVLGMKLAHFLSMQQSEKKHLRQQFIACSLGILSSFWLIAGMITLLKLAGMSVGWGMQFQHPLFLVIMSLIMFAFALNLLDVFYVYLPPKMNNFLANKGKNTLFGSYLQGIFATLLATPCSAPFLGTAIVAAFISPLPVLWCIFTFMAIGMSLPWILVALFPSIARYLPKPGAWMSVIKFILGIMMFISTLWLLMLLNAHFAPTIVITLMIIVSLITLYAIYKRYNKRYLIAALCCLILFVGGIFYQHTQMQSSKTAQTQQIHWKPFHKNAINDALKQGKTVFVNVTASWCITCKINELNVFSSHDIQTRLNQHNVVALKADWTTNDPEVTAFLHQNNQFSIPFYAIYYPDKAQPKILATLLKKWDILSNLNDQKETFNND